MRQTFEHVHGSGRFSVSAVALGEWMEEVREFADLITYTEVDKNDRARQMLADGWDGVWGDKGPRDDCAIAWRKSVFDKIWDGTVTLDSPAYKNKRGWKTDVPEAAFAVLEIAGKRLVVGVMHMPTAIAGKVIYDKTMRSFKKEARKLATKFDAESIMLVADWNKNLRLPIVRAYLRKFAPNFKVTWKFPFPARGSFGKSLIDYTLGIKIRVVRAPRLLRTTKVSDHTAYRESLSLAA